MGHIKPNVLASQNQGTLKKNNALGDRPAAVQQTVDAAFEENKGTGGPLDYYARGRPWMYNGESNRYHLLGFYDEIFLTNLSLTNENQKDMYIIDAGCAAGRWGRNAQAVLLNHEPYKTSGKHFHILSLTGGLECKEMVEIKDHVTLHQFNQFKIENIDQELVKRGFDLAGKVDLVVSNWTLLHLADPFGTLKRMHHLLVPAQGMVISTGFLFKSSNSDDLQCFPLDNEYICSDASLTPIFRSWSRDGAGYLFLLKRNDHHELIIPLAYTGAVKKINRLDRVVKVAAEYEKTTQAKPDILRYERVDGDRTTPLYWHKNNQQSEELYRKLLAAHEALKSSCED